MLTIPEVSFAAQCYSKGAARRHLRNKFDNQVSQSLEEVPEGKAQLW